jgi:acyl-coenzyme A synthetase/AMP-(fatty) acid ligase
MLHDARFDAEARLSLIEEERIDVLCMSPTEYRMIARRAELTGAHKLRHAVAAGEALDTSVIEAWRSEAGVAVRDGFGQTETGQVTGVLAGDKSRAGSMGRALPGIRAWVEGDELVVDPTSVPTFFLGYLGANEQPTDLWRTGDMAAQDEDGYFWFRGRTDDVIISSGYRIGPEEIESVLLAHPAVADVAAVAAPDAERGAVVRAIVVLRPDHAPSDSLARDLQQFAKGRAAPYKYPRIIEFVDSLPRTATGKLRRATLRVSPT